MVRRFANPVIRGGHPLRRSLRPAYPWSADHLQGHGVALDFSDVAVDLVGGEANVLTLLLVRHIRQDQPLPRAALQRLAAVREYLRPSAQTACEFAD